MINSICAENAVAAAENREFTGIKAERPDMVKVAQLVRALDCGSRGRGFDSPLSPFVSAWQCRAYSWKLCADGGKSVSIFVVIIRS